MAHAPRIEPARLVLLGTGTCQLEAGRMASSVLIELAGVTVVFDFGRGIAQRLVEHGRRQDDVRQVVLSHFHPDHLSDLVPYLHAACWSRIDPRSADLDIWGPPGLEVQLMRMLSLFEAGTLTRPQFRVRLRERAAGSFEIEGHRFESASLPPAGNHGLSFEVGARRCALTGDSSFHGAEVEFLAGADLAVIDAGHLEDGEIVELAARSQARRIVCSHLYRELDIVELARRAAAAGFRGELLAGADGMSFPL